MKHLAQTGDSEENWGDSASIGAEHVEELEFQVRGRAGEKLFHTVFAVYRLMISPLFGQTCRFEPSCSHFVEESVARHGLVRGLRIGAARLLRCHPFHSGGYDPVP